MLRTALAVGAELGWQGCKGVAEQLCGVRDGDRYGTHITTDNNQKNTMERWKWTIHVRTSSVIKARIGERSMVPPSGGMMPLKRLRYGSVMLLWADGF